MGFHKVKDPQREDAQWVSIYCVTPTHVWSIATFVLWERWVESQWFVERDYRVAKRAGRGTQQFLVGREGSTREVDARSVEVIDAPDLRGRFNLKCHRCRDAVPIKRDRLESALDRLAADGSRPATLQDLRAAIVASSTGD